MRSEHTIKRLRKWSELDRGTQQIELYRLDRDIGESKNVADKHPDVVKRLMTIAEKVKSGE